MAPTSAPPSEGPTIAPLTRSCLLEFQQCIQQLEGENKIYFSTRLADFRLWADSVGATAKEKASLDWRFQHQPADTALIGGLLSMLQSFLNDCSIAAKEKSDVRDIITNIDSTVDSLAFIGVEIRRSGRNSRLRKADSSFDKNRDKYRKLRVHLACIASSRPTEEGRPKDEGKGIHSVDHFADMKLSPILERLVEANLRRRHRFTEAQRHSHGLRDSSSRMLNTVIPPRLVAKAAIHDQHEVSPMQDKKVAAAVQQKVVQPTSSKKDAVTLPATSASGLDSKWGGLQNKRQARSTATRITSVTAAAKYPKAHASSDPGQKLVRCSCCCQAIPTSELEDSQWRKHVANDLSPYTCILEDCPTPYHLFVTQKDWSNHVMNDHPPQWQCPCCEDDPPRFKLFSEITSHLKSQHLNSDLNGLEDLLSDAEVRVMGISSCPLCDSEGPEDSPDLIEHVLQHIHDFSLRSLPWPKDPATSQNHPAGLFNTNSAVKVTTDEEGKEAKFDIAGWAETVYPVFSEDRGILIFNNPEAQEEVLKIEEWRWRDGWKGEATMQLCDIDLNPPNLNEEPDRMAQFDSDYFLQNDYFKDESSDGRFSPSTSHSSQVRQEKIRTRKRTRPKKWACTLCNVASRAGDDAYFLHLENDHFEKPWPGNLVDADPHQWENSMLDEAYWNGVEGMSDTSSSSEVSGRSHSETGHDSSAYFESDDGPQNFEDPRLAIKSAVTYEMKGRADKAVELLEHFISQCNEISHKRPGAFQLPVQFELVKAYRANKQPEKAIELLEYIESIGEGVLAETDRLKMRYELAMAYQAHRLAYGLTQGQVKKAIDLLEQVVERQKESLSEEHPETLASQHSLALAYKDDGRIHRSVQLLEHVVSIQSEVLSGNHPLRLATYRALVEAYRTSGQLAAAEEMLRSLVAEQKKVLDEQHPEMLTNSEMLARIYKEQGRMEEAKQLSIEVYSSREKVLGKEHPDTLESMNSLALIYMDIGQYSEAEHLIPRVVSLRERTVGKEHPDTLKSIYDQALIYWHQVRLNEAERLLENVIAMQKNAFGEGHSMTLKSETLMVLVNKDQGHLNDAARLLKHVVDVLKKSLGEEHWETRAHEHELMQIYEEIDELGLVDEPGEETKETNREVEMRTPIMRTEHGDERWFHKFRSPGTRQTFDFGLTDKEHIYYIYSSGVKRQLLHGEERAVEQSLVTIMQENSIIVGFRIHSYWTDGTNGDFRICGGGLFEDRVKIVFQTKESRGGYWGVEAWYVRGYSQALAAFSGKGYEQTVQLLIDRGHDFHATDLDYSHALQMALENDNVKTIEMLLKAGGDINAQDRKHETALIIAIQESSVEVIKLLLDYGADIKTFSETYGTVLQEAIARGNREVVKLLLERGADVNENFGFYGNALQLASSKGNEEVVRLLRDAGADVNAQGGHHGNALTAACENHHDHIAKLLVEMGAEIKSQDENDSAQLQEKKQWRNYPGVRITNTNMPSNDPNTSTSAPKPGYYN